MYDLTINNSNAEKFMRSIKEDGLRGKIESIIKNDLEPQESPKKEMARREKLKDLAIILDKEIVEYNTDNQIIETVDMNGEMITFDFGDSAKKLFLRNLSEIWETESSLNYAYKVMSWVSGVERDYGKPIYLMNTQEVGDIIPVIFDDVSYYGMRFRVKVFMELQNYYEKYITADLTDFGWVSYFKSDKFRDLFALDAAITKDELVDLFNITKNAQDGIIPLLLFEGINLSRVEEKDEIRYIKQEDIGQNEVRITHNENNQRVIDVDDDTQKALAQVIAQKFILTNKFGREEVETLDKSEYLLRAVSKKKSTGEPLTYRGAYSRLARCFENYETNISHKSINPKTIKTSGQYHYINKYMDEGYTMQEAMRMTLKRFGEWLHLEDESKEAGHMANRQKMNRLKKKWEVYRNGENNN